MCVLLYTLELLCIRTPSGAVYAVHLPCNPCTCLLCFEVLEGDWSDTLLKEEEPAHSSLFALLPAPNRPCVEKTLLCLSSLSVFAANDFFFVIVLFVASPCRGGKPFLLEPFSPVLSLRHLSM